jgi:threonine dehydrogenase-like Zn-dependent dehydrogenase
MHGSSADEPVALRPRVLVSIVAESSRTPPRSLIHLGVIDASSAGTGGTVPSYALGTCHAEGVYWSAVGPLDLQITAPERVLFAGLSALAMRYVREAQVQIGDPVLVLGADPWSLLLLQWAGLQGASPLVLARRGPHEVSERASSFRIDAELPDRTPGNLARAVKLTHRSAGFAIAFDGIASEQSMPQALSALRDGGRYVLAGLDPQAHVSLNVYPDLHRRDLEMVSVISPITRTAFTEMFRFSLELADKGKLQLERLLDQASGWRLASDGTARETC